MSTSKRGSKRVVAAAKTTKARTAREIEIARRIGGGSGDATLYWCPSRLSRGICLLLHGFTGLTPDGYGALIAHLAEQGWTVVWVQYQQGRAQSYAPRAEMLYWQVLDLLPHAVGGERVAVTHSLGAAVWVNIAQRIGTQRAVLIAPGDANVWRPGLPSIITVQPGSVRARTRILYGADDRIVPGDSFTLKPFSETPSVGNLDQADHTSCMSSDARIGADTPLPPADTIDRAYWTEIDRWFRG